MKSRNETGAAIQEISSPPSPSLPRPKTLTPGPSPKGEG